MSTNTFRYTMCSAPNVYMFVYTLIGAQIVPLKERMSSNGVPLQRFVNLDQLDVNF